METKIDKQNFAAQRSICAIYAKMAMGFSSTSPMWDEAKAYINMLAWCGGCTESQRKRMVYNLIDLRHRARL